MLSRAFGKKRTEGSMSGKETEMPRLQYCREIACLCLGSLLGILAGYTFFRQKPAALHDSQAEQAGHLAAKAFQKGLADEMRQLLTRPEPQRVSRDAIEWMEDVAGKAPDQIAPHELCVLFARDGYYQRVLNHTEAQAEAIYDAKYKGHTSDWFPVYVEDTSSRSIDAVWIGSPEGFRISVRAGFPYSSNEPDLTTINKGDIWLILGEYDLLFADTGKIWLDNCRLLGKITVPAGWHLGEPITLTREMFIPTDDVVQGTRVTSK